MQKQNIDRASCPASFRDPSGFVFKHQGQFYRHVSRAYAPTFDALTTSGLYAKLVEAHALVPHEDVTSFFEGDADTYKVIHPAQIPFVSYPYEWSFNQLKDAALMTLKIQKLALQHDLTLKDASAYNVQFVGSQATFIDTLSFDKYEAGSPWVAYRQFCQHFLAPLALMGKVDIRLGLMLRNFIDGIPLDLASTLLPKSSYLSPGLAIHIHGHARAQSKYSETTSTATSAKQGATLKISKNSLLAIVDSLEGLIQDLKWNDRHTEWGDYYNQTNYDKAAFAAKEKLVAEFCAKVPGEHKLLMDIGGNNGHFTRIMAKSARLAPNAAVVCADIDPSAVDYNYTRGKKEAEKKVLPLLLDLTNPSPNLGWANDERDSFLGRKRPDLVMSLALLHHIVIGNNVPLAMVAKMFHKLAPWHIVEFVGKQDSQSQRLLSCRKDIFPDYTKEGFETAFGQHFEIVASAGNGEMHRQLYLLKAR